MITQFSIIIIILIVVLVICIDGTVKINNYTFNYNNKLKLYF